jgi:hypothetical protein
VFLLYLLLQKSIRLDWWDIYTILICHMNLLNAAMLDW